MRVLLVSADREVFPEPGFPLGEAYVASSLRRAGEEVRIFDAGTARAPLRSVRRVIEEYRPDAVGLSLRSVDNAAYPRSRCYLPEYAGIACEIRAATKAPLLLAGSAFSLFPEDLLRILRAEGGVTGDGEEGLPRLLGGKYGPIVRGHLESMGDVGFPREAESVLPGFDRYRMIGVQSARGCPQACIHCTCSLLEGKTVRPRPPDAVADDLEYLAREHGKRDFFFVDSTFNADEEHMAGVCRAILSRNLPIRFACHLRPKVSDPSLFKLLAGAGCVSVEFGTDSGSDRMLETLRKGFTADDVRAASDGCRKARIDFFHHLLFGGPGENEKTTGETVRLMDETSPTAVVAMTGIRIYPGTKMHQIAVRQGVLSEDDNLLGPRHYFPNGDPYWVLKEVGEAADRRRNWFLPGRRDLRVDFVSRFLRLFRSVGPRRRPFR